MARWRRCRIRALGTVVLVFVILFLSSGFILSPEMGTTRGAMELRPSSGVAAEPFGTRAWAGIFRRERGGLVPDAPCSLQSTRMRSTP